MRWLWLWLWLGPLLLSANVYGSEVERADIRFSGKTYHYRFTITVEADVDTVRRIVTDFDHMDRINDDVLRSELLEQYDPAHLKRRLWLNHCLLVFCFDLLFVERVEYLPDGDIVTDIVPAESNFHDGRSHWRLTAVDGGRTRISVEATQTPKFWIPPVIGRFVIKRSFLQEVAETAERIEHVAREHQP